MTSLPSLGNLKGKSGLRPHQAGKGGGAAISPSNLQSFRPRALGRRKGMRDWFAPGLSSPLTNQQQKETDRWRKTETGRQEAGSAVP